MEVCRYVVLNPVRAKAVEKPEQWKWNSYKATAGTGRPHLCLTTDWVLNQFGSKRRIAEKAYRKFIKDGMKQESIWKAVRAQSIFGEEEFTDTLIEYLRGKKDIAELPKSQRYVERPSLEKIFSKSIFHITAIGRGRENST